MDKPSIPATAAPNPLSRPRPSKATPKWIALFLGASIAGVVGFLLIAGALQKTATKTSPVKDNAEAPPASPALDEAELARRRDAIRQRIKDQARRQQEAPEETSALRTVSVQWTRSDGMRYIEGTVHNGFEFQLTSVGIGFRLLDKDGAQIGITTDTTHGLPSGADWRFRCPVFDDRAVKSETVGARVLTP